MADILEQGILPELKTYDLRCSKCQTLARFERREGTLESGRYNRSPYLFRCPFCGESIWVDGSDLAQYETKE